MAIDCIDIVRKAGYSVVAWDEGRDFLHVKDQEGRFYTVPGPTIRKGGLAEFVRRQHRHIQKANLKNAVPADQSSAKQMEAKNHFVAPEPEPVPVFKRVQDKNGNVRREQKVDADGRPLFKQQPLE